MTRETTTDTRPMFATMIDTARRHLAARRAYRRMIAEIETMTRQELAEMRVYGSDLRAAARRDILNR